MNIILLSGGSGKRLWPLSNDVRSKQFIKIFKKEDGSYESMVQRVCRQIRTVDPEATVTIATSKSQVSAIHNQLGVNVGISVEPCRRDTFAAIALATAYLHDVKNVSEEEAVVVCPVDPYVDPAYFQCVQTIFQTAEKGNKKLVLMGIQPTYPSEKYGYIVPSGSENNQKYTFTEKPSMNKAIECIQRGALWNGGVFAYRLSYVLDKSKELLGSASYSVLFNIYANLRRISFDYAVVENEKSLEVVRYDGSWKDLGTWNTLTEAMEEAVIGNGILNESCENVHVVNELGIPILVMGGKNLIVSASPEGILVTDKEQSSFIKPYVEKIDQQVMFAEKSWGDYRVLDVNRDSMTVKVTLNPGHQMNYHSHEKRDETWTVIHGTGEVIIDEEKQIVKAGDIIHMPAGTKHMAKAGKEGLQMIEVQMGSEISVADKKKFSIQG